MDGGDNATNRVDIIVNGGRGRLLLSKGKVSEDVGGYTGN